MSNKSASKGLLPAVLWMFGTLASFLLMGVAGRELSAELEPHHSSFYRSAVCLLILVPIVTWKGWRAIATRRLGLHAARNSVHFAGQWGWLYGLGILPLAEVFSIEFTAPIWTALLATLFLGESLTKWRAAAIALGFAGILIILRPGVAIVDPASIVVLGAAVAYATTYVVTKGLVKTESVLTIVWWMNVVQLPIGLAFSIGDFVVPSSALWVWVLALGVTGLTSHYCIGRALSVADATIVIPLDFLRLPLAAVVAWLVYDEQLDPFLVAGAAVIILGNWINVKRGQTGEMDRS